MARSPRQRAGRPPRTPGRAATRRPPDPPRAPAGAAGRLCHHRDLGPAEPARPAEALQGTALPAGDLRLPVRPGRALAGGQGTENAAGLPRPVPGHRSPAGRDPGLRRPDDGRPHRARHHAAGHGRGRRRARPQPAEGPQRVRRAVPRLRQPGQPEPDSGPHRGDPVMKIFATYNIKGGVGKTSTAVNLSYLASRDGYRVLLWDLDPQAAATFLFRVRARVKGGGKALIAGTRSLDGAIKGTDFDNLDLLPADFTYRNLDLLLDAAKKPARKLSRLLGPLRAEY